MHSTDNANEALTKAHKSCPKVSLLDRIVYTSFNTNLCKKEKKIFWEILPAELISMDTFILLQTLSLLFLGLLILLVG